MRSKYNPIKKVRRKYKLNFGNYVKENIQTRASAKLGFPVDESTFLKAPDKKSQVLIMGNLSFAEALVCMFSLI